jgi:SnoaL-like domain
MKSNVDIYRAYYEAAWADPPASLLEASERYFSDDFQTLAPDGSVQMDRAQFIGLSGLLFSAFEDFEGVVSDYHEEGETVVVSSHFEGTHTGDLDLSMMGLGVIPASGKKIIWPDTGTTWRFRGEKIASIQDIEEGGIAQFLAPLGVTLPPA